MGTTRFKGPVYGAKNLLFSMHCSTIGNVTAQEIFQITVPDTEDWYLTNVNAYCVNQGNAAEIDVEDDGTSVLAADLALATGDAVEVAVAATAGEDEGKRVAGGSQVTVDIDNGATTAATGITVNVYGYIRKLPVS